MKWTREKDDLILARKAAGLTGDAIGREIGISRSAVLARLGRLPEYKPMPQIRTLRTHCSKGHELSGDNLAIHSAKRHRRCRLCYNERGRLFYKSRAAPKPAAAVIDQAGLSPNARSYMEGLIKAYAEAGLSEKVIETQNEMVWLQQVAVKWNVNLDRHPSAV